MDKLTRKGMDFMDEVVNEVPNVSIITKIEVLGFSTSAEVTRFLESFFRDANIWNLTDEVAEKTIELRKFRKIKLPDAIIAATALHAEFTIVTRNTKDFTKVATLDVLNPHTL